MNGWFSLGEQIPNWDKWDSLRDALSARRVPTCFKHVYSHIGILGDERADPLANQGRLQHPGRLQFLREQRERHGARGAGSLMHRIFLPLCTFVCCCSSPPLVGWMASSVPSGAGWV